MDNNDFELKEDNPIELNTRFRPDSGGEDKETSKMEKWLINHSGGIIKNRKQANYVLIGIAAISLIATAWLIFSTL